MSFSETIRHNSFGPIMHCNVYNNVHNLEPKIVCLDADSEKHQKLTQPRFKKMCYACK